MPHLVGAHGQGLGFAGFRCECGELRFPGVTLAEEEDRRLGNRPTQRSIADLFARRPQALAVRCLGARHPTTVGHTILYARAASEILHLLEDAQRQNLADARDGLPPRQRLNIMDFRTAREGEFPFAPQLVRMIDEPNVASDRLADPGLGDMLRDIVAVGLVRPSRADLRQSVLTVRLVTGGEQFGALAR